MVSKDGNAVGLASIEGYCSSVAAGIVCGGGIDFSAVDMLSPTCSALFARGQQRCGFWLL